MKLRNKKTGDAVYVDFQIPLSNNDEVIGWYSVTSLKELNESFEDYKSVEPLIKDEKIRKAVRAWAEVNNYKECIVRVYDYDRKGVCIEEGVTSVVSCDTLLGITFFGVDLGIKTETPYTIAELCGEDKGKE